MVLATRHPAVLVRHRGRRPTGTHGTHWHCSLSPPQLPNLEKRAEAASPQLVRTLYPKRHFLASEETHHGGSMQTLILLHMVTKHLPGRMSVFPHRLFAA